jgi:hypothetical protein
MAIAYPLRTRETKDGIVPLCGRFRPSRLDTPVAVPSVPQKLISKDRLKTIPMVF